MSMKPKFHVGQKVLRYIPRGLKNLAMFPVKAFHEQRSCDAPDEPEPNKTTVPCRPSRANDVRARRPRRAPVSAKAVQYASAAGTSPTARAAFAERPTCACSFGIASARSARIMRR
jgi:hypothetical protein